MSYSGLQCNYVWPVREYRSPTVFGGTCTINTTYPRMLVYWHVDRYSTVFEGYYYCFIVVILLLIFNSWKVVTVEFEIRRLQVVYAFNHILFKLMTSFYLKLEFTYVTNTVISFIIFAAGSIFRVMQTCLCQFWKIYCYNSKFFVGFFFC